MPRRKNTAQKVFIWIIAITMLVGTIGTYFLFILANENGQRSEIQREREMEELEESIKPKPLPGYEAEPFDPEVTELSTEELEAGDGAEVQSDSVVVVNYFGWLPDGEIFDSSHRGDSVDPVEFSLERNIEGWQEGLTGAQEGEVRKLVIPSDMAYGEDGNQAGTTIIPPDTPLAFIVEVIEVKDE